MHPWVIMPNHVHLLLTPRVSVSKLPGSLKAATAKRANRLLQRIGQPSPMAPCGREGTRMLSSAIPPKPPAS